MELQQILTRDEAAAYLRVPTRTLDRWRSEGKVPASTTPCVGVVVSVDVFQHLHAHSEYCARVEHWRSALHRPRHGSVPQSVWRDAIKPGLVSGAPERLRDSEHWKALILDDGRLRGSYALPAAHVSEKSGGSRTGGCRLSVSLAPMARR